MKLGEKCEVVAFEDYAYFDSMTRRFEIELFDFYGKNLISPLNFFARQ